MILRPWKRLRQIERNLASVELVVLALAPPRSGGRPGGPPRTVLRKDLGKLAAAGMMSDDDGYEVARGAVAVRLERKLPSS